MTGPSASPSIVVIGAGVAGLASALHLSSMGASDVHVLEASDVASGSSGLSVGIIETQYLERLDIELRVRSMEFFHRLESAGLEIVRNGYLRLSRTDNQLDGLFRSLDIQHEFGVNSARVLDPSQIAELVPDMRVEGISGGLFGPTDGYIDGYLYCGFLARMASDLGVKVLPNQRMIGFERGSRLPRKVITNSASFECDWVVNAAGAWAGAVGELLGAVVDVSPQRHQVAMVQLRSPLPYTMPCVMDYTPHSGEYGLYFRDEGPGRLIAGLHTEEAIHEMVDPDSYARQADPAFLDLVAEKLGFTLPSLTDAGISGGWAGLYPMSANGYPVIGPHPDAEGVVVASGLGGFGVQVSPMVGQLVAEWILNGEATSISESHRLLPGRRSV